MRCKCIKDYNDGYVNFKINELYEYISIPTSGLYPAVYKIYNGIHNYKNFSHDEFNEHFMMAA